MGCRLQQKSPSNAQESHRESPSSGDQHWIFGTVNPIFRHRQVISYHIKLQVADISHYLTIFAS